MIEPRNVSVTTAVACVGWLLAVGMFGAAVVLHVLEGGRTPILVAEGACIISAMAATAHVKTYGEQVCQVVRDRDELAADIRSIRTR